MISVQKVSSSWFSAPYKFSTLERYQPIIHEHKVTVFITGSHVGSVQSIISNQVDKETEFETYVVNWIRQYTSGYWCFKKSYLNSNKTEYEFLFSNVEDAVLFKLKF